MDEEKYIASGVLELYVAGVLSEEENLEVYNNAQKYPKIKQEIEEIEGSILAVTKTLSPGLVDGFDGVKRKLAIGDTETKVVQMPKKEVNPIWYVGWAASLLLIAGLVWMYTQNQDLKSQIKVVNQTNSQLEQQIADSDSSLEKSQELLETLRDQNVTVVALGGQEVAPESYAKAYWNKSEEKVYIDAKGLPEPPDGFVYQVWSLKLDPLIPTSMGLLEDFVSDENKVFALANPNDTEAFGITLEPAGGSESPTLEQLYTLGVVSSS